MRGYCARSMCSSHRLPWKTLGPFYTLREIGSSPLAPLQKRHPTSDTIKDKHQMLRNWNGRAWNLSNFFVDLNSQILKSISVQKLTYQFKNCTTVNSWTHYFYPLHRYSVILPNIILRRQFKITAACASWMMTTIFLMMVLKWYPF